jgi:hopanoid biosynthesis associated radical SAM protein HpnH
MDGQREHHDFSVCREGGYDIAAEAIREALAKGFRVTTNTTLFDGARADRVAELFDTLMDLGVEGLTVSPGYRYAKAPDQDHFLRRAQTHRLFRRLLAIGGRRWRFNQSPLFLEFLKGTYPLRCTPWGNPTYNVFGWQKPCYLIDDGYAASFHELMAATDWDAYGRESGNPRCADCMVHCGYEPTAIRETFGTLRGLASTARITLFGPKPLPAGEPLPDDPRPELVELPIITR